MSTNNPLTEPTRIEGSINEFNSLLEANKPYTKEFYREMPSNEAVTLEGTTLAYLPNIQILICSKHRTYIEAKLSAIVEHFKVSASTRF